MTEQLTTKPEKVRRNRSATDTPERRALLAEHGLMTEAQTAEFFGIALQTFRNRSARERPAMIRLYGEKLYRREAIEEFLRRYEEPAKRRA